MSKLQKAIKAYNRQLNRFHFNEAAKVLYEFTWNDFCDWYIEIAKTRFYSKDSHAANVARVVATYVLRNTLAILHPFAPFISEELWAHFKNDDDPDLIVFNWPKGDENWLDGESEKEMALLQEVISGIRTVRSRMNIPPTKKSDLIAKCDNGMAGFLNQYQTVISSLTGTSSVETGTNQKKPDQSATVVIGKNELYIPLGGLIDLDVERSRLQKRANEIKGHLKGIAGKLLNEQFISKAPNHVIIREKDKQEEMSAELEKVNANLEMLQ